MPTSIQSRHRLAVLWFATGVGLASIAGASPLPLAGTLLGLAACGVAAGWSLWHTLSSVPRGIMTALIPIAGFAMKLAYC